MYEAEKVKFVQICKAIEQISFSDRFSQMCFFSSANPTKWSNTLKQFVGNLPTNCLSVFDQFMILAFKGLKKLFRLCTFFIFAR